MTIATVETAPAHAAATLTERLDYARALAAAGLLPDSFRAQPANVLVGMELASALEMAPIVVINELSVIGGKPSFSAKFMRSLVRRAGHRIRETYADGTATCTIIRADDPEFAHVATWDEAKARQHDYWNKGHWKKNPGLMLKNRALSECVREACPEVLGGVAYTPDEVADFVPRAAAEINGTTAPTPPAPTFASLADAVAAEQGTPASPASPAPADAPTAEQTAALGRLLRHHGLTTTADQLAAMSEILGRQIKRRADLTADDVDRIIADLEETVLDAELVDPETGEVAS